MIDVFDAAAMISKKNNQKLYRERIIEVLSEKLRKAEEEQKKAYYRNGRMHSMVFGADLTREELGQQIDYIQEKVLKNKRIMEQIENELNYMLETLIV